VCKHGNRKASSTSGAFDLLDELGFKVELTPAELETQVAEHGLGFAFARTFHPAMRFAGPVRAGLGIPTVFNVLGPLSHPGRVRHQVIGTAEPAVAERLVEVFRANQSLHTWVVNGDLGVDEIAVTGPTQVLELQHDQISEWTLNPEDYGIALADPDALRGGGPKENAAIVRAIFAGEDLGPRRDMVVINAAAGLVVAGLADDLTTGIALAQDAIDNGKAAAKLVETSAC